MPEAHQDFKALETQNVPIQPHPQSPGVSLQYLVSQEADGTGLTCALVHLPVGCTPEPHIHKDSDDLLYVLRGEGKLWVSDLGTFPLVPGTFIRVPKGLLHAPLEIVQDLLIYNVWHPAIR